MLRKTLVILRHAHRDNSVATADNGLSERGRAQAQALKHYFQTRLQEAAFSGDLEFLSSPKLRCQQTIEPLAQVAEQRVSIDQGLNEQTRSREDEEGFEARIAQWLSDWTASDKSGATIICSHGDWIPLALRVAVGHSRDIEKGSWSELTWDGKNFAVVKLDYVP